MFAGFSNYLKAPYYGPTQSAIIDKIRNFGQPIAVDKIPLPPEYVE